MCACQLKLNIFRDCAKNPTRAFVGLKNNYSVVVTTRGTPERRSDSNFSENTVAKAKLKRNYVA